MKAVIIYIGNIYQSVPVEYVIPRRESHENIGRILAKINVRSLNDALVLIWKFWLFWEVPNVNTRSIVVLFVCGTSEHKIITILLNNGHEVK